MSQLGANHVHDYSVYVEDGKSHESVNMGVVTQIIWGHNECACGAWPPPPPPPLHTCITKAEWLWQEIAELCDFAEGSNSDDEAIICLLNKHL